MLGSRIVLRWPHALVAASFVAASLFAGTFSAERDAEASSVAPMDIEGLATRADRILVGTVEKAESHFLAPDSHYIVTDVTIRIEQRIFGGADTGRFVVRYLGGEVGKLGQRVYGEASYTVGERVLLFATLRQGSFYAVGMSQGVLHVYDDAGVPRLRNLRGRSFDDVLDEARYCALRRAREERSER
jgi:hypothetical protein